ncbi:MAG: class C sortase [Clostridia bacterium]|nr:class C sortase [Clostridia bacterium]
MSYPTISNWWNEMHTSKAVRDYSAVVTELDTEGLEEMKKKAHEYNRDLAKKPDQFAMNDEMMQDYYETLDVTGTGIMGYVTIPSLDVNLPIYHGVDDTVLQTAVGHMEGSSMPVGGMSTHVLLSGHRGLPSAKLFTHLDKMEIGDIFYLTVLDETLVYQVSEINTVLPTEPDLLYIEDGKDMVTLITCTPYGVNTHRLLVRGTRVTNTQNKILFDAGSVYESSRFKLVVALCVLVSGILVSSLGLWLVCVRRRK